MPCEQRVGGAEFGEDLVVGHHVEAAIRLRAKGHQHFSDEALEAPGTRAYRGPQNRGAASRAPIPTTSPGGKMRLIGWAIALAAAGLTPAAAQAPAGAPTPADRPPAAAPPAPPHAAPPPRQAPPQT